jgi:hypothetical protein
MRPALAALLAAMLALGGSAATRAAEPPSPDVVGLAVSTFMLGCVAHDGDYAALRERLQPGRDLYLPQLPPTAARPFLQGRDGDAWSRPDAGITLALLKPEETCVVFVRKVGAEALHRRLETELRASLSSSFAVRAAGEDRKGAMRSRFIDLIPTGEYRTELTRRFGTEPTGLRVILTTSETANPDLQAIITIGTRAP